VTLGELAALIAGAFSVGGVCALTLYRLKTVERIARKAHQRLDALDDRRWVSTDVIDR